MQGDEAVFYRVVQHEGAAQIALVLLNKSDTARTMRVTQFIERGEWIDAMSRETLTASDEIAVEVPAHGVRVLLRDAAVTRPETQAELRALMRSVR